MTSSVVHSFFLGEKQYLVHNEEELALIIDLLATSDDSFTLHRHIIMSLDERLMDIILTYKGLLLCMKHMEYKNRFLLLIKIGDTLSRVIEKSTHLGNLLASIPEETDKIRIIKSIRYKGLTQIIDVPDDLGNILEWIFGDGEKLVIDTLGKEFLQSLFTYGTDIYKVFHFLSDKNKNLLADMIELSFIKSCIYTAEDFFYVLKALSNEKTGELIPLFTPEEIRTIIRKDKTLHHFLPKLTKEKEHLLLQYIKN
ncbi:hypothetical protein COW06_03875 [Candidatus Gracilibacteria bacterium CG12_big_fil_rev_8_21_14_0_65_38_15]|nr:MAG: hypothetical protein COW06_03875 [Candidatus Gracilibacteria bacterium CG12_big_fil_rev_8_21_14_0_65_38_15]PIZ01720.1 MAG: hypothetical protein COY60_02085 [Candidatus Gracilibacteria bacterium CG_4_10_14_0_8_um_filter_38_28]